ncbi:MAG: DNA-processing protein DprA [Candidatus Electrothrix sp. YB6]
MQERNDIREWLTLVFLPGLGSVQIRRLLAAFGAPSRVLAAGRSVAEVPGIGKRLAAVFSSPAQLDKARCRAEQEYARVRAGNFHLLCCDDPLYPTALQHIHNPPVLLYCQGDLACLQHPAVAVVGSRTPTEYGRRISAMLARQLVSAGVTVVSGLAVGIDGQAHIGALEAGGRTIAVLGCGLDVVYPGCHARMYKKIREQGLLLSEYPLGTRPHRFHFPERNRIISGLSQGVVIVEAAARSGALITARLALEQNREVFAVPGSIESPKSEGPHGLLRQGATLVRSVDDILQELPPVALASSAGQSAADTRSGNSTAVQQEVPAIPEDLPEAEKTLLSSLGTAPVDIEQLTEQTELPLNTLHGLLLGLELKGLICQLPGQQYIRATVQR